MTELGQEDAAALHDIYERALKAMEEAEPLIWRLPRTPERDRYLQAHTSVIVGILSQLRAPLVLQYPELDMALPEGPLDTELDDEELQAVGALSESQVALIDGVLLADCASTWRKVARIVGTALTKGPEELAEVPVGFFARRVRALVESGKLEAKGDLNYMRFSEVRLPL
jgi:hypothetical protein